MSLHSGLDFFISKNARLGGKTDVASMKDSAAAIWPRVEISLSGYTETPSTTSHYNKYK